MLQAGVHKTIFCLTLLLIVMMFAQASYALNFRHRRAHTDQGLWSFQVALDEKIDDNDEHGLRLSLSHHYSSSSAVRFNMGIVGRDNDYRTTRIFYSDGYVFEFDDDRDFDITGGHFSLQFLSYPTPGDKMRFFWGIGPRLSINDAEPDRVFFYNHDFPFEWYEAVDSDDLLLVGLGLEATFGLEMFLGRDVSLLAEYGFTLQNQWYVLEYDYYDEYGYRGTDTESFDDGVHFDASRIKLGLAVYF